MLSVLASKTAIICGNTQMMNYVVTIEHVTCQLASVVSSTQYHQSGSLFVIPHDCNASSYSP